MRIDPYLFFDGRAEEALNFYKDALGGEITMLMRYGESPAPPDSPECVPAGGAQKIQHAMLAVEDQLLMMSDGVPLEPGFRGHAISLGYPELERAQTVFSALAAEGEVLMPFSETFFSPGYGMLIDRFGVQWIVMTHAEEGAPS